MTSSLRFVGLCLLLVCAACGGESKGPSDDASIDANVPRDARVDSGRDSGSTDTGVPIDTGLAIDSGFDSGNQGIDAGPMDAGFDACPGTSASATAAQVCTQLCSGNVAMYCSGMDDGGCVGQCLTAHASYSASQLGNMLACTQMVTSNMQCGVFGACYSIAKSCP